MGKFSKLFGAAGGTVVGQGLGRIVGKALTPYMEAQTAEAIGEIIELVLPLVGTYLAPANK